MSAIDKLTEVSTASEQLPVDSTSLHPLFDEAPRLGEKLPGSSDVPEQMRAQAEIAHQTEKMDRLAVLERFQRLTVGRELTMIELRKGIESLREYGTW